VHGNQEGKFFHGYYRCYCYLPLYVVCGDCALVASDAADGASETLARLVTQIRARWPEISIVARGGSGFARDGLMNWCEGHGVYYVLGLVKNQRLLQKIGKEMVQAQTLYG